MSTQWRASMKDGREVTVIVTDCGLIRQPFEIGNPQKPLRVYRTVFEFDGKQIQSDVDAYKISNSRGTRTPNLQMRMRADNERLDAEGLDVNSWSDDCEFLA